MMQDKINSQNDRIRRYQRLSEPIRCDIAKDFLKQSLLMGRCFSSPSLLLLIFLSNTVLMPVSAQAANLTWDSGDIDDQLFSSGDNWDADSVPLTTDDGVIASTADSITWDSPTTLSNFSLSLGFNGSVTGTADTDISVTNTLTVNDGVLATDAVITVADYVQGSDGTLQLTLDSKIGGQYGRIDASGTVTVGGTLTILNDGLTFSDGDTFTIFDSAITGTFSAINLPALSGNLQWNTVDLYTSGVISVGEPMIINIDTNNGSGTVDLRFFGPLSKVDIDWGDITITPIHVEVS